jgi:DNA replication protein DnaC
MNNISVAEVIANYRRDRINQAYTSQQKTDALPGMRSLRERKKKLLKKIIAESLSDEQTAGVMRELEEIGRQEKEIAGSLPAAYTCDKCGDSGFVDGRFCACLRDRIYREAYGAFDIESLSESFDVSDRSKFSDTFACKNGATQREKYIALENYAKKYAESFPHTQTLNLLLTGSTGLGKTFILRSIAKAVYARGEDVMLIGAGELFSAFHRHRLGHDVELAFLRNCSLLLIDDLGVEPATQNVTKEYFLDLLNKRIDGKKNTVIASNLTTDNIAARYGERVYSRLRFAALSGQLVFEGVDIRLK